MTLGDRTIRLAVIFLGLAFFFGIAWLLHADGRSPLTQQDQDNIDAIGATVGR